MAKLVPEPKGLGSELRVYVVGGGFDYIRMLYQMGYVGAKGVGDADIILFTGGEDVSPSLYNETPLVGTRFSVERDKREVEIFKAAKEAGTPMVGICRGGQFLNVMNGGKMWQDVNNHCGSHVMIALDNKGEFSHTMEVTSTHHQMMIPAEEGALLLAYAHKATRKAAFGTLIEFQTPTEDRDTEVLFYPKTNCLCFQPHPEYHNATAECTDFFEECLDNFIVPNVILEGRA